MDTRKSYIVAAVVVVVLFVGGFVGYRLKYPSVNPLITKTITFSRDDLQARIDTGFPIIEKGKKLTLEIDTPQVVLEDGVDRIGLDTLARIKTHAIKNKNLSRFSNKTPWEGGIHFDGQLEYDCSDGTIYYVAPLVQDITFALGDEVKKVIREDLGKLIDLFKKLDDDDDEDDDADEDEDDDEDEDEDVDIAKGINDVLKVATVHMNQFFKFKSVRIPIYTLDEAQWKQYMLKLVLKEVRVENGMLIVKVGI